MDWPNWRHATMTRKLPCRVTSAVQLSRYGDGSSILGSRFALSLLGGFRFLNVDRNLTLCHGRGSQRLLAQLAIRSTPVSRDVVAGLLWPNVSERCAHAALRSALARLARSVPSVVRPDGHNLCLAGTVSVDLHEGRRLANRLVRSGSDINLDAAFASIPTLSADLLPGWYDDWLLEAAENWRQLRLHALESLADALSARRRFAEAITAAGAAIGADPLRETPRAAMMRVHLAEGNRSEATREFERYRRLALRELRLEPTERLRALLASA